MAATEDGARTGPLAALMQAALALPIIALPAHAGAAQVGEIGFALLGYKERGLMKVTEPLLWTRLQLADVWEIEASGAVDIVTGASPESVSNASGRAVQTVTGASIQDRRKTGDLHVRRRIGEATLGVSGARSDEHDYHSRAYGLEASWDLNQRNTTLAAGYGHANDHVGSSTDPTLDAPRRTHEYLVGITQVLSPLAIVQGTVTATRGSGWYNDPYKLTITFPQGGGPVRFMADTRPAERETLAALVRYRRHFVDARGTLQLDYRFYRDDWGVRAHTLEAAWERQLDERWSVRPALRYYTQAAADFYGTFIPEPPPAVLSSDQRLGAFGGLSPSLRVTLRLASGLLIEGTAGYVYDAARLRLGGGGSPAFETLRAAYGLLRVSHPF